MQHSTSLLVLASVAVSAMSSQAGQSCVGGCDADMLKEQHVTLVQRHASNVVQASTAPTYTKIGDGFCGTHTWGVDSEGTKGRAPACQKAGVSQADCEQTCTAQTAGSGCLGYSIYRGYCMLVILEKDGVPSGYGSCGNQERIFEITEVESVKSDGRACYKKEQSCTANTDCSNRNTPFMCFEGECKHCDTITPATESECHYCPDKAWTGLACVPCKGAPPSESVCSQCGYGWSGSACTPPATTFVDVGAGVCNNGFVGSGGHAPYCQNSGWGSGHANPAVSKSACEERCAGIPPCTGYTTGTNGYCFLHLYERSAPADFPYCFNQGSEPNEIGSITSASGAAHIYHCYTKEATTPTTTIAPVAPSAPATAVGDPHLVNTRGEHFSIFASGQMEFIRVPYQSATEHADFTVHATIQSFGETDECKQAQYITGLLFGGSWFKGKPLDVNVDYVRPGATKKEMKVLLGGVPVMPSTEPIDLGDKMTLQLDDSTNFVLKVGEASVAVNLQYYFLNVEAQAFTKLAPKIGGLLGEDDHESFSMKPVGCQREVKAKAALAVYSSARMTE